MAVVVYPRTIQMYEGVGLRTHSGFRAVVKEEPWIGNLPTLHTVIQSRTASLQNVPK